MRIDTTSHDGSAFHATAAFRRGASRRQARRAIPASTYRAPSVVTLKPGPLAKLAWIFGLR